MSLEFSESACPGRHLTLSSTEPNRPMDLSNSSSKIEPFLLIAKSAKGAAAARLVEDATAAPGVFVFSELLEIPNIQEVC